MHFQNTFAAAALLAPLALASPEAAVRANQRYGGGDNNNYGGGSGGGSGSYGRWTPGTSIYSVTGTAAVPGLSATAPLISATATVNNNGYFAQAQASLKAIGNGPGMCPQDPKRLGTFIDAPSGKKYNLFCGQELTLDQGVSISKRAGVTWQRCLDMCANQTDRDCDAVVYSRLMWVCWTKHMGKLSNPILNNNTDRYFAYEPNALQASFATQTLAVDKQLIGFTAASTKTSIIPAAGTVTVSGDTSVGTVASGTASISNGTTVGVNILIRWQ